MLTCMALKRKTRYRLTTSGCMFSAVTVRIAFSDSVASPPAAAYCSIVIKQFNVSVSSNGYATAMLEEPRDFVVAAVIALIM
jgi:hypothetical protein